MVIHLVKDVCTAHITKRFLCLPSTKSSGVCFPKATQLQWGRLPDMEYSYVVLMYWDTQLQSGHLPGIEYSLMLCSVDVYIGTYLCVAIDKDCIYIIRAVVPLEGRQHINNNHSISIGWEDRMILRRHLEGGDVRSVGIWWEKNHTSTFPPEVTIMILVHGH